MYHQSEFGKLETYLLEKKYIKNKGCEKNLKVHIFTGTVEFKRHRFKRVSLFLIKTFDEKTLEIMNKFFVFLCIMIALSTTIYSLETENPEWYFIPGITTSLIPLILSLWIQHVLEYHHDTFCRKCGNKLACEETGDPVLKETSNHGDYTLTVTRHWKCRYCGNVDTREGTENVFTEKGEMQPVINLKGFECKKCIGRGTVKEFKKPDIKEIGNKRIIRRYYRCTLCGHEEIRESEEIINRRVHTCR